MSIFITFEGVEGSGKSTQIQLLRERLEAQGHRVLVTREPGGCAIADAIRAILLDPANRELVPRAELLLYAAARAQHVEQVIRPALAAGNLVLCDRFIDATTAYQGSGRGLSANLVAELNGIATAGVMPELTLLFDLPAELGLSRARRRNQEEALHDEGRFEMETLDFHRCVRDAYLELAGQEPRFRVIDATGPAEAVADRVQAAVAAHLEQRVAS